MKVLALAAIALSLSLSPKAEAASAATLATTALKLLGAAEQDVVFLYNNVANCTRFASTIQSRMLTPMRADLKSFRDRIQGAYGKVLANSCSKPSSAELESGLEGINVALASINDKIAKATQPQSDLMGMTGDEAMRKALTTDSSTPNCRAEDRNDPSSTRELKTYLALKLKMLALKASAAALAAETKRLKEGRGNACQGSDPADAVYHDAYFGF